MTAVASLCDCSFKLRNALLSTKIVDLLLRQLRELRLVLQLDQVMRYNYVLNMFDHGSCSSHDAILLLVQNNYILRLGLL